MHLIRKDSFHLNDRGFYVDVGSHHPDRFSNTKLFYEAGWTGINIDPNDEAKVQFENKRPRDTNLKLAVGEKNEVKEFFKYNETALNSFHNRDKELIKHNFLPKGSELIQVETLENILNNHVGTNLPQPNFLDVDVEGYELEVLRGNNWSKFKFSYILIEQKLDSLDSLCSTRISEFLKLLHYKPMAHNGLTTIYKLTPN